jgi:hypothetical protein
MCGAVATLIIIGMLMNSVSISPVITIAVLAFSAGRFLEKWLIYRPHPDVYSQKTGKRDSPDDPPSESRNSGVPVGPKHPSPLAAHAKPPADEGV